MKKIFFLALLLYNFVSSTSGLGNYDYDNVDANKRQSFVETRRNWRKKALLNPITANHKDWNDRRRHDYEYSRYTEDPEINSEFLDRQGDLDISSGYRGRERFAESEMFLSPTPRSAEVGRPGSILERESEKKTITLNCDRQHERYETCFAGCSAITCDNPRDRLRPCYPFCEPGCICVHPYVRDDRTHKCVLPEDCTKGLKGIPDLSDDI